MLNHLLNLDMQQVMEPQNQLSLEGNNVTHTRNGSFVRYLN